MNKIFNKFLIGLLFVLGVIIVPAYKVEAAITVVVKADGVAANKTVAYNSTVKISWDATGATSCSEGKGRGGTGTYGEFTINSIQATETFTVECSAPAYCSGTYVKEADWNGNTWDGSIQPSVLKNFAYFGWVFYNVYDGDGGGCGNCSQRGNLGYRVQDDNGSFSWFQPTCVKTGIIGCSGSRWSQNAAKIRSAYVTKDCSDFSGSRGLCEGLCYWDWGSSSCRGGGSCNSQLTTFSCHNYPVVSRSCTWNP